MIVVINGLRASYGLAPYAVDPLLMEMAQQHSLYQASIHHSTHQHSDGRDPPELGVVENVAGGTFGYVTPSDVVYEIWADPGHLHTMIGFPDGVMGVGVADDGETVYYTLEVRSSSQASNASQTSGTVQSNLTPIPLVPLVTVTPFPDGSMFHTVGYGQSLWSLAVAYGVTTDQLRAWNNIPANSNEIYAGQKLLVRLAGSAMEVSTIPSSQSIEQASTNIKPTPTIGPPTPTYIVTIHPTSFISPVSPTAAPLIHTKSDARLSGGALPIIGALLILVGGILALMTGLIRRK
jgi:uncharacterized protein YkwD